MGCTRHPTTGETRRKFNVKPSEQPVETSVATTNGQRILLPEFSDLAKSFSQITSQNFELLKMARMPGTNIGKGHEIVSTELRV